MSCVMSSTAPISSRLIASLGFVVVVVVDLFWLLMCLIEALRLAIIKILQSFKHCYMMV